MSSSKNKTFSVICLGPFITDTSITCLQCSLSVIKLSQSLLDPIELGLKLALAANFFFPLIR